MGTKIIITDGFAKDGLNILQSHPGFEVDMRKATPAEELAKIIDQYDCIVIRSATKLTKELIEKASNMKLIVRAGAGVDNIDVPVATEKKIPVMNTASANALAAAEQTIALMFSMMRYLPQAAQSLRENKWDREVYKGYEVTGKTLGVIGLGAIGRIVAEKAIGLGMTVVGYDPMAKSKSQVQGPIGQSAAFTLVGTVDEVLAQANIITVHVPKNKDTQNLINAERIAKMKDKSWVINCSRGGIVNEKDVMAALKHPNWNMGAKITIDSGKLLGAAFDVYEKEPPEFPNPVFQHPKVVCAPHLGASTFEAQDRVSTTAANQIIGFFSKGDRTGVINKV